MLSDPSGTGDLGQLVCLALGKPASAIRSAGYPIDTSIGSGHLKHGKFPIGGHLPNAIGRRISKPERSRVVAGDLVGLAEQTSERGNGKRANLSIHVDATDTPGETKESLGSKPDCPSTGRNAKGMGEAKLTTQRNFGDRACRGFATNLVCLGFGKPEGTVGTNSDVARPGIGCGIVESIEGAAADVVAPERTGSSDPNAIVIGSQRDPT